MINLWKPPEPTSAAPKNRETLPHSLVVAGNKTAFCEPVYYLSVCSLNLIPAGLEFVMTAVTSQEI